MKIFILCLMIGLTSCVSAQSNKSSNSENRRNGTQSEVRNATDISLCEFLQSPEKFEQKSVRIKGIYRYGFEWSELYSLKCATEKRIWVEGAQKANGETAKCGNADKIDEMDFGIMGGRTVGVVAVGSFTGNKVGYGHMNAFDYLFKIECFERAKMLDREGFVPDALTLEQRRRVEEFEK